MFNEKKKEDVLLQLIREELASREGIDHKEQELRMKPSIIQGVINSDLPFYEDHLREIVIQETQVPLARCHFRPT